MFDADSREITREFFDEYYEELESEEGENYFSSEFEEDLRREIYADVLLTMKAIKSA